MALTNTLLVQGATPVANAMEVNHNVADPVVLLLHRSQIILVHLLPVQVRPVPTVAAKLSAALLAVRGMVFREVALLTDLAVAGRSMPSKIVAQVHIATSIRAVVLRVAFLIIPVLPLHALVRHVPITVVLR